MSRLGVAGSALAILLAFLPHTASAQEQATAEPAHDHEHASHAPVQATGVLRTPIPALTAADREAAAPPLRGHAMHGRAIHGLLQFDHLETWREAGETAWGWEVEGWVGTDLHRLWLRSEGERAQGHTGEASVELLAGRSISAWWDVVAGLRHDFGVAGERDYAALGLQGLAPYWIEVKATAYVGGEGRSAARLEFEHDLLLTNRLILQAQVEADFHGKDDIAHRRASGLSSAGAALRLRYEFTRRFAPYAGLSFERAFGGTADLRRDLSEGVQDTRFVIGVRTWF